jgi:hypothetical protein
MIVGICLMALSLVFLFLVKEAEKHPWLKTLSLVIGLVIWLAGYTVLLMRLS